MSSQSYNNKPHYTKVSQIPAKHMPPKPTGPDGEEMPWEETHQNISFILRYANNTYQSEKDKKEHEV